MTAPSSSGLTESDLRSQPWANSVSRNRSDQLRLVSVPWTLGSEHRDTVDNHVRGRIEPQKLIQSDKNSKLIKGRPWHCPTVSHKFNRYNDSFRSLHFAVSSRAIFVLPAMGSVLNPKTTEFRIASCLNAKMNNPTVDIERSCFDDNCKQIGSV